MQFTTILYILLHRKELQEAINSAWANQTCDPHVQARLKLLFPEGKPDVKLFILRLAAYANQQRIGRK